MTEGFIRQRRNLIIANVVLLLLAVAEVQIDQLTIVGVQFNSFKNPGAILLFLWAAWSYFLYRYTVYFFEEAPQILFQIWVRDSEKIINKRIKGIICQAHREPNDGCGYSYQTLKKNGYIYKGQAWENRLSEESTEEERQIYNFELPIPRTQIMTWEIAAFFRFMLLSPPPTDYVFALLLSLWVAVYCGFLRQWDGNMLVLLLR